ncbi:hypothetical protein ACFWFR_18430, partial [Oerskovia sp. NPDC060287]|uniref:hypothetical protein n=1 Tax=Oerskovia sp. NPDC060287 TaxID=3347095 RepID=UPI003657FBC1
MERRAWLRPTIRIRLTLLYGGMFLIAGILLLSIIYLLAAQAEHVGNELRQVVAARCAHGRPAARRRVRPG